MVSILGLLLGQDENVYANLLQYGLEKCYIDMLVSDSACSVWRNKELFDAIITDRKIPTIFNEHHHYFINEYIHVHVSTCTMLLY